VLIWSKSLRGLIWFGAGILIGTFYLLPLVVIAMASFAGEWNGILPSKMTLGHYTQAVSGDSGSEIRASLATGIIASAFALIVGTWAALSMRSSGLLRRVLGPVFFIPSAVPSVSVGLGLLVAFSRPPILLNGTTTIVIIAHFVLVFAFAFGNVSAGLARLPADFVQVAQSLGARPAYCLFHVTLPLLFPQLASAFSLSFALSMGELGATVMVYPPGWVTLPVGIFALTDRGEIFEGAALTIIMVVATLLALVLVSAHREKN
jgi:2-aminoethylphosphonate transport system permease protein